MFHKLWILFVAALTILTIWLFVTFNSNVTEDLIWFNNSDQNGWVIYSSLDFNDGLPSKYISHPGVASSFVYGAGFRILKLLGVSDVSKTSDLADVKDPIAHLPKIYRVGSLISIVLILLCALLMSSIVFVCSSGNYLYSLYGGLLTLVSSGFLFHSVMLRNELTSVYYFLVAFFLFIIPYKRIVTFFENKKYLNSNSILFVSSGFFFGLSYFSKSQIIITAVFFFIYLFYRHACIRPDLKIGYIDSILVLIGHVVSFLLLLFAFEIEVPVFWKLVYIFCVVLTCFSVIPGRIGQSFISSFMKIISRFSLGFTLSFPYLFLRGLKSDTKSIERILTYTSFWNPGESSIQAQTIDKDITSIMTRFLYFLQSYFVESLLLLVLIFSIVLLFKRDKRWKQYLIGVILIILVCYLNSIRRNVLANVGRSVFKYIVYVDIAAVLLVVSSYVEMIKVWTSKKNAIHFVFWTFLFLFGLNNMRKVQNDTKWDWTTYSDIVFLERWLMPGAPPSMRKLQKEKYKGFYNGHDRVIFGDELARNGKIEIPGGEGHLKRVQRLSQEPYFNRMKTLFKLEETSIVELKTMESRLLQVKINAFLNGDNYQSIVNKAIEKRKFLYKKVLEAEAYEKYIQIVSDGRLSVPF